MDAEYEQLLKEHAARQKGRRHNSFAVINNLYRILRTMAESKDSKFFTLPELGFYEGTRNQIHIHAKQYIIDKSVQAKWIKQISLSNDEKEKMQEENLNGMGKRGRQRRKRMTETKYYTLTDEGIVVYKNIKEILDKLAS